MLEPVARRSLGDAVFDQLLERIVSDALAPGEALPPERVLCEAFQVNRGAVREALKRLAQIRLVATHQGGASRVRDWRDEGGLELLPVLLAGPEGRLDTGALRGLVEMRTALGADAARLAAERGRAACAARLDAVVDSMRECASDLEALQDLALVFWRHLVEGAENVAYRLAFNSLRASTDRYRDVMRPVIADELRDHEGYAAVAAAVRAGEAEVAAARARRLVDRGARGVDRALGHARARNEDEEEDR